MAFNSPNNLTERASLLKYTANNPSRAELAALIPSICQLADTFDPSHDVNEKVNLQRVILAPWILALEHTADKAWWGDPLDNFVLKELSIAKKEQIDADTKFISLVNLYIFLRYVESKEKLVLFFKEKNINIINIKTKIAPILSRLIQIIYLEIKNVFPVEETLNKGLDTLYERYIIKKQERQKNSWWPTTFHKPPNKERCFLTQLAAALVHLLPGNPAEPRNPNTGLTDTEEKKWGFIYYILQVDYDSRWLLNSDLDQLCMKIFHIENFKNVNNYFKLACIAAFKDYFNDNHVLEAIKKYGGDRFKEANVLHEIHIRKIKMDQNLARITMQLLYLEETKSNWRATTTLAEVMASLAKAPFYGLGYMMGFSVANTQSAVGPKTAISSTLIYVGRSFFGFNRVGFSYLASTVFFDTTLTRAFAKVLEQMGMIVGYATGGAIGLTIDLTYEGLQSLCNGFFHLYKNHYDPKTMQGVNPEVVRCLQLLPREIYKEMKLEEKVEEAQELCALTPRP